MPPKQGSKWQIQRISQLQRERRERQTALRLAAARRASRYAARYSQEQKKQLQEQQKIPVRAPGGKGRGKRTAQKRLVQQYQGADIIFEEHPEIQPKGKQRQEYIPLDQKNVRKIKSKPDILFDSKGKQAFVQFIWGQGQILFALRNQFNKSRHSALRNNEIINRTYFVQSFLGNVPMAWQGELFNDESMTMGLHSMHPLRMFVDSMSVGHSARGIINELVNESGAFSLIRRGIRYLGSTQSPVWMWCPRLRRNLAFVQFNPNFKTVMGRNPMDEEQWEFKSAFKTQMPQDPDQALQLLREGGISIRAVLIGHQRVPRMGSGQSQWRMPQQYIEINQLMSNLDYQSMESQLAGQSQRLKWRNFQKILTLKQIIREQYENGFPSANMGIDILAEAFKKMIWSEKFVKNPRKFVRNILSAGLHFGTSNRESFVAWKQTVQILKRFADRKITLDTLMNSPSDRYPIRGTLFDTVNLTSTIFQDQSLGMSVRSIRGHRAAVIAFIHAVTHWSFAADWLNAGKISPIGILILCRVIVDWMQWLYNAVDSLGFSQTYRAAVRHVIFRAIPAPVVKFFVRPQPGNEEQTLQMSAQIVSLSVTQGEQVGNSFTALCGIIIKDLADEAMAAEFQDDRFIAQEIKENIKNVVQSGGVESVNNMFLSVQRPQNQQHFNKFPAVLSNANKYGGDVRVYTSRTFVNVFQNFVSSVTEFVDPAKFMGRNDVNRKAMMKVVAVQSQISKYSTNMGMVRAALAKQIMFQLQRRSFGSMLSAVRENLRYLNVFMGLQFCLYDKPDEAGLGVKLQFRSVGIKIRLSQWQMPSYQQRHENVLFMPGYIQVFRKRAGSNTQYDRITTRQVDASINQQSFWESMLTNQLFDALQDSTILEVARDVFTTSGPTDDQVRAMVRLADASDHMITETWQQQLIKKQRQQMSKRLVDEAGKNLHLNNVTFITAPVFNNYSFPLFTASKRFSPTTGVHAQQFKNLLEQRAGSFQTHLIQLTIRGLKQHNLLTCCTNVYWQLCTWFAVNCTDQPHECQSFLTSAAIHLVKNISSQNNRQLPFWIGAVRDFMKSELQIDKPIFIFFTSSCQVVQFESYKRHSQHLATFMSQKPLYLDYPAVIVTGEFSDNAHAFVTTGQAVHRFTDAVANQQLRGFQRQHKNWVSPGFVMFKKQMYQKGSLKNQQHKQILDHIMDSVWALDIETYSALNVKMQPYCISVVSQTGIVMCSFGQPQQVRQQFRELLTVLKHQRNSQSKQLTIYAHNGSKFDWVVLMRDILQVFQDIKVAGRTTEAKFITIPSANIRLADFFLIITQSLESIATQFKNTIQKTKCQQIKDLQDVEELSIQQSFKIMDYCVNDCQCLLECVQKFTSRMLSVTKAQKLVKPGFILPATSAKLAQNIFSALYIKQSIIGNLSKRIDEIQKSAYYGGVTQVFSLYPQTGIRYIDVNSLYPAAMTQMVLSLSPAMPQGIQQFRWDMDIDDPEDLIEGFLFDVQHFRFKKRAFGMLPVRTTQGGLVYPQENITPNGVQDWRAGVELQALVHNGMLQTLIIKQRLRYPEQRKGVFTEYINDIYQRKAKCTEAQSVDKMIYKLLLNQLYGKFAQRDFEHRVIIKADALINDQAVPQKLKARYMNISLLNQLMHQKDDIVKNKLMELYLNKDDQKEIQYLPQLIAIDRIDQQNKWLQLVFANNPSNIQAIGQLKRVSLFTTAFARAIMIRALGHIYRVCQQEEQNLCDHVFYMDTDSFFCSQMAYKALEQRNMISPDVLGLFKNEVNPPKRIVKAQFFASKVYFFQVYDPQLEQLKTKFKFKGMKKQLFKNRPTEQLYKMYQNLLDPDNVQEITQRQWRRKFGQVKIQQIVKRTISKPRRRVLVDGSTQSFKDRWQFQEFHQLHRVAYDKKQDKFGYVQCVQHTAIDALINQ